MLIQTSQKRELFASTLKKVLLGVFAVVLLSIAWTTLRPLTTTAATSSYLNFQARLQTAAGAIVPDGNYNIEFKLYSASSGGSALWTEDYLNSASQGVRVANGFVSVNLGSITAFPTTINWDQQLWLTMNVGGTTTGVPSYDGEMTPRLQLTAVPYAFKAGQLAQANSGGSLFSNLSLQAPTVGNQVFQIQDQGAAGTYNLLTAPSGSDGYVKLQGSPPGTAQTGSLNISGTAIAGTLQSGTGGITDGGALTFSGSTTTTFTTPNGSSIATKINVPLYDPGAFNQIIALGLARCVNPAETSPTCAVSGYASSTARAITIADARIAGHQPTIALLSPDETQIFGLSYDGSNTTAYVKSTNASIGLQASGRTILSATYTSPTSGNVTIGDPTNVQGSLVFANSTNNAGVIITSGVTSTQYTIQLPTAIGTAGQCLGIASVASTVETLGYTSCGGGTGFVSLQAFTPGTPDSGNLNISGVGTIGTSLTTPLVQSSGNLSIQAAGTNTLSLDTAGAGTVSVGGTNAGTVTIANNAAAHTVNIATGVAVQTVTIGSTNGASVTNIQGGTGNINLLTNSASASIIAKTETNSTTGFQIQNASSVALFNVDTTTGNITLGTSGNTVVFTTATGLTASGTARHVKTILLTPEFTGAVLDVASDASCSSANNGTMTSAYDSAGRMNNYNWMSTIGTAQCYDVVVQVAIPSDFSSWSGTPDIEMKKDATGTGAYALEVIPSSGSDANYGSYVSPGTLTTTWSNVATSSLSGTYTAGDYLTIKVRLTSTSSANVKLGNIKLSYNSNF